MNNQLLNVSALFSSENFTSLNGKESPFPYGIIDYSGDCLVYATATLALPLQD